LTLSQRPDRQERYAEPSRFDKCPRSRACWPRKFTSNLQVGLELFHQTPAAGTPPSTSLGLGAVYDLNDRFHLLGYVRTGLENRDQTDRFGWYSAVLFTF
jgi:hypothetical protein